ncbi:MAG: hypothetical protein WAM85_14645 [Terracidiphilus sp.]
MHKERLDSWKSIADYLRRSTRTVQRWHTNHGLPVRHFRGPKGAAFAYPEEIDAWLSGFSEKARDGILTWDRAVDAKRRSLELTAIAEELWAIRSEKNIHSIAGLYREAIDEDSGNAAAFAGLANAMIFVGFHGMVEGSMAYPRSVEALSRMARIEPDFLKRKCSAAWLDLAWKRKWSRARAAFDETLRDGPRTSFALSGRSLLHVAEGNLSEAWECAWEAWNLNTLARPLSALLCWIPYLAGEFDKCLQRVSDVRISGGYGPTHAAIEALALIQAGTVGPHMERLEGLDFDYPNDRTLKGALGYHYGNSGQKERAFETLESLERTRDRDKASSAYAVALVLLGLEKPQEAIHALEASYASGSQWSLGFRLDPMLKPLRGEQLFQDFLRKAGPHAGRDSRGLPRVVKRNTFGAQGEGAIDVRRP